MSAVILAVIGALGAHWLYSAVAFGWAGFGLGPAVKAASARPRRGLSAWLAEAGLDRVNRSEFSAVVAALFAAGGIGAYAVFGSLIVAAVVACFVTSFPVAGYQTRRSIRRQRAMEAWPRMIEEIRLQTSSLGRSIPQALFEVGRGSPRELRPAFEAAHREWLLTTDLTLTLSVLKDMLADPTADAACETLLIAHELGGGDLDRRLEALAEDRRQDVQDRKDARSRQAGARFARAFVLIVPAGMALAGMSIGTGRDAYRSGIGQAVVLLALLLMIGCWAWAGRVMRLPHPQRVFDR